ncbi:hypothetical protein [Pseudochryseolinea flava]|uniref:Leucine-rich repeat domain-containing protein n=1 Tax=Pseudochryseolinea flava TaxID=2059302 RepID=A0A364Y3G9_9BACT|nr:hypothetical protein [Pseudochryseolinea flava]RAW01425.1 hypothetical protein DQQ10_11025 [Pseudochryseolinea flava]
MLRELPPNISRLTKLEEIDLSDNYFNSIPNYILEFPNLKIITLVNNPFDETTLNLLHHKFEDFKSKEIYLQYSGTQP